MIVLYLGLVGLIVFTAGAAILGLCLRKNPSKANAEKSSRIMHFLYFAGLGLPVVVGLFSPGITRLDQLAGMDPLPWKTTFLIVGIIIEIIGLYYFVMSNKLLRAMGSGANAFLLTKKIVETDVYKFTRNPMSLGYYLGGLGLGFISGSTLFTLYMLLGIIPAHLFFLKFFEEFELELRLGKSYKEYKQNTSFLFPTSPEK